MLTEYLMILGLLLFVLGVISFVSLVFFLIFRERGKERESEGNNNVWLPLWRRLLGTWPTTQACALTGHPSSDPFVHRPALDPLRHTRQGFPSFFLFLKGSYTLEIGTGMSTNPTKFRICFKTIGRHAVG